MSAKADKTGSCSFCGQTKIIQVPEEWEQGQINEAVTCECECEQAQAYTKATRILPGLRASNRLPQHHIGFLRMIKITSFSASIGIMTEKRTPCHTKM